MARAKAADTNRVLELNAIAREFGAPALNDDVERALQPGALHTALPVSVRVTRGDTLRPGPDELILWEVAGRSLLPVVWQLQLRDDRRTLAVTAVTPEDFADLATIDFPADLAPAASEAARAFLERRAR